MTSSVLYREHRLSLGMDLVRPGYGLY